MDKKKKQNLKSALFTLIPASLQKERVLQGLNCVITLWKAALRQVMQPSKKQEKKYPFYYIPIVRPRAGNFSYSDDEFAILKEDILMCKQLSCDGISTGVQKINGEIDTERLQQIVEWAYPMGVTCHRVFDCTPDPFKALEDIIHCGCERILTSGLQSAAPKGTALLQQLIQQAGNRIIIMPGAGVNSLNIAKLKEETGATEFHSSAKRIAPNPVIYLNKEVSDYGNVYIADEDEVKAMVKALEHR